MAHTLYYQIMLVDDKGLGQAPECRECDRDPDLLPQLHHASKTPQKPPQAKHEKDSIQCLVGSPSIIDARCCCANGPADGARLALQDRAALLAHTPVPARQQRHDWLCRFRGQVRPELSSQTRIVRKNMSLQYQSRFRGKVRKNIVRKNMRCVQA